MKVLGQPIFHYSVSHEEYANNNKEYTIVHRIIERFSLLVDQFILGFQCDENLFAYALV